MAGSSSSDEAGLTLTALASSILGVHGSLRLRPHGSTQKPHLILRRVVSSDDSSDDEEDSGVVRFSLFAQKRIDVKPGKEILLCVATEDGALKDIPLVFEGSAVPEISLPEPSNKQDAMEVDEEDKETEKAEGEVGEGGDAFGTPMKHTMPPKMRRAWKKVEEPKVPTAFSPTRISVGVQAEPDVVSTAVEAIPETCSVSIEARPATSSTSIQAECSTSAVSIQVSPDVESAGIQTIDFEPQVSRSPLPPLLIQTAQCVSPSGDVEMDPMDNDRRSLSPMELDSATNSAASSPTTSYFPASLSTTQTSLPDRSVSPAQKDHDERSTSQDLPQDYPWGASSSPPRSPPSPVISSSDFIPTSSAATSSGSCLADQLQVPIDRDVQAPFYPSPVLPQASSLVNPTVPPFSTYSSENLSNPTRVNEAPASGYSQHYARQGINDSRSSSSSTTSKPKRPGIYDLFVPAKMSTGPDSALDIIPTGIVSVGTEQVKEPGPTLVSNQVPSGTESGLPAPHPVPEASTSRIRLDPAHLAGLPAKPSTMPPKFSVDLNKSELSAPPPAIDPSQVARPGAGPVGNPLGIRPSTMPAALRNNITSKVPPAGPRSLATMGSKKPVVIGSGWSAFKGPQNTAAPPEQSALKKQKRGVQPGVAEYNTASQSPEPTQGVEPKSTEVTPAPPPSLPPPPPPPPVEESSSGSKWKPVATHDSATSPLPCIPSKDNVNGSVHTNRKVSKERHCGASAPRVPLLNAPLSSSTPPEPLPEVTFPSSFGAPEPVSTGLPQSLEAPSFAGLQPSLQPSFKPAGVFSSPSSFEPTLSFPTPPPSFVKGSNATVMAASGSSSTRTAVPTIEKAPFASAVQKDPPPHMQASGSKTADRTHLGGFFDLDPSIPSSPSTNSLSAPTLQNPIPTTVPAKPPAPPTSSVPPPMSHPLPPKPMPQPIPPSASSYRGLKRERPHSPDSRDHHRRSRSPPRRRPRPHIKCPTVTSSTTKVLQGEGEPYLQTISFSSDGQFFVITCSDQTIRVWNTRDKIELARLTHHSPLINAYWLENDAGVIALTDDGLVSKWTRTGENAWKWAKVLNAGNEFRSDQDPICFAYSRDRIAVSFPRLGVKVWIWSKGIWQSQRSILRQNVTAIEFIDGGAALLGGTRDGALWCCEIPNGTLRAYAFLKTKIISLDVSPAGTHVLVGSVDGSAALVALCKSENKGLIEQEYKCKDRDGWTPEWGDYEFGSVFATKGQAILFGSVDSCVLVWDKKKGSVVYGLEHDEDDCIQTVAALDSVAGRDGCMITGTKRGQLCWWALPVAAGQSQGEDSKKKQKVDAS